MSEVVATVKGRWPPSSEAASDAGSLSSTAKQASLRARPPCGRCKAQSERLVAKPSLEAQVLIEEEVGRVSRI